MRAGACTAQQTLTSEAASVLKHSLGLARRRGHAQVTPLHVAATLLSPRASLLRRACLKSHPHSSSHPLQCRALELCFNVALNRLPTTPGPLLHAQPSLSNALIAALKRAQAHQRRGCIEQQQQQPLLAIKVELEQLIISILDDPSVSRVMREAGFSSTTVKNNLEDSSASSVFQCYSSTGGIISSSSSSPTETHREIINHGSLWQTNLLNCYSEQNPLLFPTQKKHLGTLVTDSATEKEDFRLILEVLLKKKRRNTVIISDYVSMTEDLVAELMAKVERGEVPDELRLVHFIKFGFSSVSLKFMKREDVETKLTDLRRKVGSLVSGGGAVIYAGDLKWTVETSFSEREGGFSAGEVSSYNPSDHLVAEIGRLLSDYSCSNSKVWLLATSNYQTYMRCQMKQPPLESQWNLQAVSVPSGGLGLSLHASRMNAFQMLEAKPFTSKEEQDKLTCAECTSNFEREARIFKSGQQKPSFLILSTSNTKDMTNGSTHLPYWLQPQRTDTHHKDDLVELKKKWNRLCHNLHHPKPSLFNNQSSSGKSYAYSSSCPWWPSGSQYNQTSIFPDSSSISFTESTLKPNNNSSILSQFGSDQPCPIEFCFENGIHKPPPSVLSLDCLKYTENKEVKISLALGNPLFSDSLTSWNQKREERMDPRDLCKLLQENLPWQSEIIPSIAEALLNSESTKKKGTWLLIQGTDWIGKRRLALATAASICGSTSHLVHMDLRRRENKDILSCKILTEALRKHEKCVVLLEDIDYADTQFIKFLVDGLETRNYEDTILQRRACFDQAIFIVTTSGSPCFIDMNKKEKTVIQLKLQLEEISPTWEVANFTHKREAEWDLSNRKKHPRNVEKEDASSVVDDERGKKKELWRQVSSNTLDLNIRAEEEEEEEEDEVLPDNSIPNPTPSDVTQATMMRDLQIPYGFLESIEKSFVLDEDPTLLRQMGETFLSKMNESLEEVCGSEMRNRFSVDKVVLEEMVVGSGSFLNGLFEFWLKDIFQTSLITVKKCGKEGTVRLSLGGKGASVLELGFMESSLPKMVQLAFKDSV